MVKLKEVPLLMCWLVLRTMRHSVSETLSKVKSRSSSPSILRSMSPSVRLKGESNLMTMTLSSVTSTSYLAFFFVHPPSVSSNPEMQEHPVPTFSAFSAHETHSVGRISHLVHVDWHFMQDTPKRTVPSGQESTHSPVSVSCLKLSTQLSHLSVEEQVLQSLLQGKHSWLAKKVPESHLAHSKGTEVLMTKPRLHTHTPLVAEACWSMQVRQPSLLEHFKQSAPHFLQTPSDKK
mmetsp:Transcript_713/g.1375  ORF Transcript_713/g.1375 Transcript_713/m.1375 type:complete len:234 (+) Transcript_713:1029-1730(+)